MLGSLDHIEGPDIYIYIYLERLYIGSLYLASLYIRALNIGALYRRALYMGTLYIYIGLLYIRPPYIHLRIYIYMYRIPIYRDGHIGRPYIGPLCIGLYA